MSSLEGEEDTSQKTSTQNKTKLKSTINIYYYCQVKRNFVIRVIDSWVRDMNEQRTGGPSINRKISQSKKETNDPHCCHR